MAIVIVVGDGALDLQVFHDEVRRKGYQVEHVSSGQACLATLERHGDDATVIAAFVVHDPVSSSLDGLAELRGHKTFGELPAIVCCPAGAALDMVRCEALNVESVLTSGAEPSAVRLALGSAVRLAQAQAAQRIASHEADRAQRLKVEFLANVSHEIRTPMNGVMGLSELLMETRLDLVQHQHVEGVLAASGSLLEILNDILDFATVAAGEMPLELAAFDLAALLGDIVDEFGERAGRQGLELLLDYPHDLPTQFVGDGDRLRQVLSHLVNNGLKFTSAGHVLVSVESMDFGEQALELRLSVSDTGVGLAGNTAEMVFEAFCQGDGSSTRRFGGLGLGLSLTKRLVELMGGTVGVTSSPGEGSTFWVRLRLPLCEETGSNLSLPGVLGDRRLLLVESTGLNLDILERHAKGWGMRPAVAHTGAQAMSQLRAAADEGDPFEVVLVDAQLPDMDGLGLAQALRAEELLGDTALVLTTAAPGPDDRLRCEGEGFAGYLAKPLRGDILQGLLALLCTRPLGPLGPLVTRDTVEGLRAGDREPSPGGPAQGRPSVVVGHVLVVEDNPLNQRVASGMLESLGYRVDMASDGVEGLRLCGSHHYDVVLMDCQMPVMDGFETTKKLRLSEGKSGRHTPVVAMTAHALAGDRARCIRAGMDDYLSKPLHRKGLAAMMQRWRKEERPISS